MAVGTKLEKIYADSFVVFFEHFWVVLEIMSSVYVFLFSNPIVLYVASDSVTISSQKFPGQFFESSSGRTHGHETFGKFEISIKNVKSSEIQWRAKLVFQLDSPRVWIVKIHQKSALRAIFKILTEPCVCSMGNGCVWQGCMKIWWWI